jgi:peptidyl-prolyl cis-trans isomerase D
MLDTIRRHQQSWLTYLIFIAIIVVFAVNFGPGSSSCRSVKGTSFAASVDGDLIRQHDFALIYQRRLEAMRRRMAASNMDFSADLADKMGLRTQVLDQLIDQKLLAHEAKRRGLVVSDEELLNYLEETYKVTSVSEEQYREFVERNFQTTVTKFEDEARDELLGQKMARMLTENVTVGDAQLKHDFLREHDRAKVDFVRFDLPANLPEPTAAAIAKLIASEPKAIEERYNSDALKYRTPEQRRARQIVVKLAADASDADVARARSQLLTLKDQIQDGADFATVAKQNTQDEATKEQGGDLGWLKRGQLPKAIEDAAFALKAQEITAEPVRSPVGLHLVQVTEIKAPARQELNEVQREVAASIVRDRAAEEQSKAKATALLAQLEAGKTLADLTQSSDEAKAQAEPDKEPAPAKGKAKAKDAKAAASDKPVRHESGWIIKAEMSMPDIGFSPEVHDQIFTLSAQAPLLKQAPKVGRAYFVIVLKERETPDLAKFDAEKDSLRDQAAWQKRRLVFDDWVKQLRAQARIEVNSGISGKGRQAQPEDEG